MILIIKGTVQDALDAARSRGVNLKELRMTHHVETMAVVDKIDQRKVYSWFNETGPWEFEKRQQYPAGTLLWFTFARSED